MPDFLRGIHEWMLAGKASVCSHEDTKAQRTVWQQWNTHSTPLRVFVPLCENETSAVNDGAGAQLESVSPSALLITKIF